MSVNTVSSPPPAAPGFDEPTFAELYTPKFVTILREGYSLANFRADAVAGAKRLTRRGLASVSPSAMHTRASWAS